MIIHEIIIKLKNINIYDDVIVMFNHERLIKEFLIIDYKILVNF